MIPVYIGYDRKESVAYHVLAHSILSRASVPVQIIPLNRANLAGHYWRPRGEMDSTDFSNSRWIVPHLQHYKGWAIFMDCDMLCLGDIAELWEQRDSKYAVMVKQHDYTPKETTKFLGQEQTKYTRKNWSSLMLMNTSECQTLSKHVVNTHSPGLWFHQFRWLSDDQIGGIKGPWNLLVGHDPVVADPKLVHFTTGGRWHGVEDPYSYLWLKEFYDMLDGDNPVNWRADGQI